MSSTTSGSADGCTARHPSGFLCDLEVGHEGQHRTGTVTFDRPGATSHLFQGRTPRECGEHRTLGERAWCYDDREYCSPYLPCRGCELPILRERLRKAGLDDGTGDGVPT